MKNPVVDPETMFPKVENMIYKQVWKCANSFRIPFEIVNSQASLAFVKACYTYKPAKASFVTWCYFKVSMNLKDLVIDRARDRLQCLTDVEHPYRDTSEDFCLDDAPPLHEAEDSLVFLETLEDQTKDLTPHAEQFLSLLMDTPPKLIEGKRPTAKQLGIRIKRYMVDSGIERPEVERAFSELGTCLNVLWA